jgi:glycosyltransferase involved in cell wall biosynthesis
VLDDQRIDDSFEVRDERACRLPLTVALAGGEGAHQMVADGQRKGPGHFLHGILPWPEISSLLTAADVLVCPSRTTKFVAEQFGKAAVEAIAVGTPEFANDSGALSEVIAVVGVVVEGAQDQIVEEPKKYFAASAPDRGVLARGAHRQAMRLTDGAVAE